jgi:hypothetical protein
VLIDQQLSASGLNPDEVTIEVTGDFLSGTLGLVRSILDGHTLGSVTHVHGVMDINV